MPSYSGTLACQLKVATEDYTLRKGLVRVGASTEVNCIVPTNAFGRLAIATVSLLYIDHSDIVCSTNSTPCYDLLCTAPCVATTIYSDVLCNCPVSTSTHFTLVDLSVGQITYTDRLCVVNTYQYYDISAIATSQATESTDLWCGCHIAAETDLTVSSLDIGYTASDIVGCYTIGELYDTLSCSVSTGRHDSDLQCSIAGASRADYSSTISCQVIPQAGDVIDYIAFEVVLGERYMSTVRCTMKPAEAMTGTMLCATSYVLNGPPRWSRFNADGYTVIRLYNMGQYSLSAAILRDDEKVVQASALEQLGSLWQAKFDNAAILPGPQIIVLTIDPGTKAVVIDSPTGTFSL